MAGVQSLFGELRSQKPHGMAKNKVGGGECPENMVSALSDVFVVKLSVEAATKRPGGAKSDALMGIKLLK